MISNAVPVFRPPEEPHARQTLGVMIGLLIAMFVGVVLVAHFDGATPVGSQTVLSEIAHRSVGGGAAYGFVQVTTTLVLLVAANSAFNGFPGCSTSSRATGSPPDCSCGWVTVWHSAAESSFWPSRRR